jgi:opacity protein-like surface antigen
VLHFVETVKIFFLPGVLALISSQAFAQTPASMPTPLAQPNGAASVDASLATPTGHEVNASVGSYTYIEPGAQSISIHGTKVGGEYTATLSLNRRRHWFAQADVRGTIGNVTYTGWCSPFLITPNSASPNGYELDLGDASPCSETGDKDWYLEARALAGKDVIGQRWALSPFTGLGLRHLSNGTNGTGGYRTDDYLYLPVGLTARTKVASRTALSFNLEFDLLIHGWQNTRDSELGGGDVPATTTAPAFTIDGFTDISFSQPRGWALRAGAKYQVTKHWSVEPYYVHWNVSASPVNYETATFTVNHVTAKEQFGAYEPLNVTHEFGVKWGFHLCGLRRWECNI